MDAPAEVAVGAPRAERTLRWIVVAVALAALAVLFYPRRAPEREPRPGGFLVDAEGRPVQVTSELAPLTLVHFWATWCPPCRTELPELVRYARERGATDPRVLFVAVGDDVEAARDFLGAGELRLLFDPAWEVAHRFRTGRLPETHLVLDGKVVHTFVGATAWSDAAIRREVQKWSASPASAAP
jgi:cytochrome c biogenesis protein CcmG, thiol:disulfide interchange protein DsbE